MGFSVTISTSIILIGLIVLFSSASVAIIQGAREITCVVDDYLAREREKLDVRLELQIESLNARNCTFTVKNLGCKTIFLRSQNGFQWNTVAFSYGNGSEWRSYLIEDYSVLEVRVSGTNTIFDPDEHPFINPGEEAKIVFSVPDGAPDIPVDGIATVAFVTHYGVVARAEGARS